MLNVEILSFREFVMHESLPLAKIQTAILEFLQGRTDAVLFGAQAVNAYVDEPRATQDVDIISNRADGLAEELREYLSERFHIAVRTREVAGGKGLRMYQVRKDGNRHLADIRSEQDLPNTQMIENLQVMSPVDLIVSKVLSYESRRGKPKSGTDWRDLGMLLTRFPELKSIEGKVSTRLSERDASEFAMGFWKQLTEQDFAVDEDDDLSF